MACIPPSVTEERIGPPLVLVCQLSCKYRSLYLSTAAVMLESMGLDELNPSPNIYRALASLLKHIAF